ncbi:hypothetical protein EPN15_01535 [Patescibacteria group bacterium]|nr:MAG: hypothetical protein EPN15_01535 [Patescibacteria group bacterium]
MRYDYFIACRWRNKDNVLDLARKLRAKGKKVYTCFDSEHSLADAEKDPEEAMKKFEAIPNWESDENIKKVFETDMNALRDSETLILLLPAGKSAHIEAGAAFGMGKYCILIGEQKEAESNYLIFNERYLSADEFVSNI